MIASIARLSFRGDHIIDNTVADKTFNKSRVTLMLMQIYENPTFC